MKLKRTAVVLVAGAALAAWLAAAATSGNRRNLDPASIVVPSPVDSRGAGLASEIEQLHARLRPTTVPNQPGRNLFAFGLPKPRPAVPVARPTHPDDVGVEPPRPPLRLSGLAEDATPSGTVRTAVISGLGQLFLVREGEDIVERYRVVRISSDVVELTDLSDGSTFRLALR
jgi:hypothetical protein